MEFLGGWWEVLSTTGGGEWVAALAFTFRHGVVGTSLRLHARGIECVPVARWR